MRVMRARTGLWEPRGGNALGPPGPERVRTRRIGRVGRFHRGKLVAVVLRRRRVKPEQFSFWRVRRILPILVDEPIVVGTCQSENSH